MSQDPGWYYYDGDPAGTVRRWSGNAWIGFPMEPPPEHLGHAAPIFDTGPESAKPFANQRRLVGFGLLGGFGVLIMLAAMVPLVREILDARAFLLDPARERFTEHPLIEDPFGQRPVQVFGLALAVGGALFLLWLWRANENIGRSRRRSRPRAGSKSPATYALLALVLSPIGAISILVWTGVNVWALAVAWVQLWVFYRVARPVPRIMFNLIERSAGGTDQGKIAPFVAGLWWPLWLASAWVLGTALLIVIRPGDVSLTDRSMLVPLVALAAHAVSLLFALRLIWVITKYQDRRLRV